MTIYSNLCLRSYKLQTVHQDHSGHSAKLKDAVWHPKNLQSKDRWQQREVDPLEYVAPDHAERTSAFQNFDM